MKGSMDRQELKRIIEALLFVSERPATLNEFKVLFEDIDTKELRSTLLELKSEYEALNRAFRIEEIAEGFQITTDPVFAPWIKKFYKSHSKDKLSRPSLEALAIIAYKQPASRAEIEAIRGVNVEGILRNLLEMGLIRVAGRKESVGRPIIYGTTNEFLQYFGLNSLKELPAIEAFKVSEVDIELPEHLKEETSK